jgi:hypothetical protein
MPYDAAALATIIRTALSAFALIFLVQAVLLPGAVERFRQTVFGVRRDMFLFMVNGGICPDDPAYVHMRATMNGLLRYAERVTLLRTMVSMRQLRRAPVPGKTLQEVLDGVEDKAARAAMCGFRDRVGNAILVHVIFTSPVGWGLILAAGPITLVRAAAGAGGQFGIRLLKRTLKLALKKRVQVEAIEAEAEMLSRASIA